MFIELLYLIFLKISLWEFAYVEQLVHGVLVAAYVDPGKGVPSLNGITFFKDQVDHLRR